MEIKYIKDFVIALVVILVVAYGIHDYYLLQRTRGIAEESKYKRIALSDELLGKIQNIENSIQDRKQFVFTVRKDPLEQNLIVKTKKDLEKQWIEQVEEMVRLQSTMITENGEKYATISHRGENKIYRIGDSFTYGKITDIREGEIVYNNGGKSKILQIEKLPEKPHAIKEETSKKTREYNW
ncbi:MAG: hypothetical protein JXB60_08520 [Candidatus Cloacimonetes bacterium]|nr:hypothetical protein [Candidatus Cloacimonadota bacterium]